MVDALASSLLATPAGGAAPQSAERIRAAAEEFESVFLSTFLKTMFEGVNAGAGPEFGGGSAEQNWRELLVDEYAKSFAARGGIGIADAVSRELLAIQERSL